MRDFNEYSLTIQAATPRQDNTCFYVAGIDWSNEDEPLLEQGLSDEDMANARLIAAAPELLNILREFVPPPNDGDFEAEDGGRAAEDQWWANYGIWLEFARSAIAKATGGAK